MGSDRTSQAIFSVDVGSGHTEDGHTENGDVERGDGVYVSRLALRRALLGILLVADVPLSVLEITRRLHASGRTTWSAVGNPPTKRVADSLDYLRRIGKVERVRRGVCSVVTTSMSRTTRQRCIANTRPVGPGDHPDPAKRW